MQKGGQRKVSPGVKACCVIDTNCSRDEFINVNKICRKNQKASTKSVLILMWTAQVEGLVQNDLRKYPSRLFLRMKIPRQTKNAYDPDFASFKNLVRACAGSKTLMKRPVQTKIRYDTDFGSFDLWKDSGRSKKFKIQTLARSNYENTLIDKYRQNGVRSVGVCRFLSVSSDLLVIIVGF